jgi:hypothetical protein
MMKDIGQGRLRYNEHSKKGLFSMENFSALTMYMPIDIELGQCL